MKPNKVRVGRILALLDAEYGLENRTYLFYGAPHELLIAVMLSAQCTDARVNLVTPALFAEYGTPEAMAQADVERVEELIRSCGFFRTKAKMLKQLPGVLNEKFGGVLPDTVEALCELPGVGRKTANLVVALGFDKPAICVDVHVHRISNRFGLIKTATPFETEMKLREILPRRYWKVWNSYIVAFGQTRCFPRNPKCDGCPVATWCDSRR